MNHILIYCTFRLDNRNRNGKYTILSKKNYSTFNTANEMADSICPNLIKKSTNNQKKLTEHFLKLNIWL